jgi:hypothetical protein
MDCNLVSQKHRILLVKKLEDVTQLPLPKEDLSLGNINFFLYRKSSSSNSDQYVFQIQWGAKSIFVEKNIILKDINKIEDKCYSLFRENAESIRTELIQYCISQLNNIILVELPIQLRQFMPTFNDYRIFVDISSGKQINNNDKKLKWPPISIFISWDDEFGDFQEFVYPLKFSYENSHFILDYPSIIKELKVYWDHI